MTQYFDNLSLSKKLSLLAISLMIPLIILAGFSAYLSIHRIIVTKREITGVNYIIKSVPIWLNGSDEEISKLIDSRADTMRKLNKQNHQFYLKDSKSPDYIKRVKQISGLVDDLNNISIDSGLSLETDESAYYLQILLTQYLPQYFASVSETALLPNQVAYVYTANNMNRMIIRIDRAFQIVRDGNKSKNDAVAIESLRNQITDNAALIRAEIAGSGLAFKDSSLFKDFNAQTLEQFKTLSQILRSHLNRIILSEWLFVIAEFGSASIMIIFSFFLVHQISRSVVTPMSNVISVMDRLSYGKIPEHMPRYNRKDEVGKLADATHRFYTLLIERQNTMDSGKLEAEKQNRESEIVNLYRNFNNRIGEILSSFTGASEELSITANTMSQTAFKASSRVASVANAAEEVTVNIKLVADSSDNLVKSLDNISQQVETSQATTRAAVDEANNSINLINDLSEAAKKIGTIVGLINSIASQTNLLALNATIEAARAGEAGRGFAVVASEVKSLASQTARATDEIANQINSMQTVTDNVVHTIQGIATTIQKIDTVAADIWDSVRRERISTKEIAFSVGQASQGTQEVSGNIIELTQAVEKTSVAATQVLSSANILSARAGGLQNNIEEFLISIEKLMQESNKAIDTLLLSQFTTGQKSVINA